MKPHNFRNFNDDLFVFELIHSHNVANIKSNGEQANEMIKQEKRKTPTEKEKWKRVEIMDYF